MCDEVEIVEDANAPLSEGQVDLTDEKFYTFYSTGRSPLSNFFPCTIDLDGVSYPTLEHFWQAAKFPLDVEYQAKIRAAPTVEEAHFLGEHPAAPLRIDWD